MAWSAGSPAVLIADVVGYVRPSQADEEGTRARFQADLDEVFEPTITVARSVFFGRNGKGFDETCGPA